jgi:integrase
MGHQRKDGRWQITVSLTTPAGAKKNKTLYAKTQRQVQIDATDLVKKTKRRAHDHRTIGNLIEAFKIDRWPAHCLNAKLPKPKTPQKGKLSEGAVRQHQPAYKRFLAYFRDRDIRDIDKVAVTRFVRSLELEVEAGKITGRTVQAYRNVLSSLMTFAEQELGWLEENTAKGIKLRASAKPRPQRRITPFEYNDILAKETNPVLHDYWELLGETGLRPERALHLTGNTIFYSMDIWWIRGGEKTPAGTDREIPLPDKLANRLMDRAGADGLLFPYDPSTSFNHPKKKSKEIRAYNYRHIGDLWAKACEAAAVPYTHLYMLRKMVISRWIASGLPDDVVKSLAGHASICLTKEVYLRLGRERLLMSLFTDSKNSALSIPSVKDFEKDGF